MLETDFTEVKGPLLQTVKGREGGQMLLQHALFSPATHLYMIIEKETENEAPQLSCHRFWDLSHGFYQEK